MKNGFSLIEVLIVMVIVGILTTIAYPSYRDYITRGRRSDGQAALLNLATLMERYYSKTNTYQTATIATGTTTDVLSSNQSPQSCADSKVKCNRDTKVMGPKNCSQG